jgi:hypothetical protein
MLEQAIRLQHRRCAEQGTRWFATAEVQGGGGRGEHTLMQGRRLRTWWGHPAGMNTASPGYCSNCQGSTPYSAFSAARCLAVSMNVCVQHSTIHQAPGGRVWQAARRGSA